MYSQLCYNFLVDGNKPRNLMLAYGIDNIMHSVDFLMRRTRPRLEKDRALLRMYQDTASMLFSENSLDKSITGLKLVGDALQMSSWNG